MSAWVDDHWAYVQPAFVLAAAIALAGILGAIVTWLRDDHA